ncbi:MAG: InlB B-repeat-containing protein, partial [Lachnospiraceae bacterium]|nr:InlB B-repeat-containing protein [Lachnospiraceae bacterium]
MKKSKLKKSIAVLLAAVITFSNFSGIGSLKEVKAASTVTVKNNSFENTTSSSGRVSASDWSTSSSAQVVSTGAQSGSKCLKITNNSSTVNEVTQTLELEESTEYVLTGYIKGENISGVDSEGNDFGDGATIDFDENTAYMVDHTNNWMTGTFGWKQVKVYFVTPSNPNGSTVQVKLRCRLGHMWGNASGTAFFDNISIQKQAYPSTGTDRVKIERANVSAYIKKDIVDSIGYNAYCNWIDDVQKIYESYKDLTGSYPYNGDKVILIDTDEPMIQRYGGIANYNPILLSGKQEENFKDYAENDCMNFGVLHEMGHVFDKKTNNSGDYGWNFNGEFWTNTKMLYVLDNTDVDARIDNTKAADRKQMGDFYEKVSKGGYYNFQNAGVFNKDYYDALSFIFVKIVDTIGWEPFKTTFRQYVNGEVTSPMTTFGKFNKFICLLQENYNPNGTEVMDCIGAHDFNLIRKGMEGGDSSYFSKYLSYSSVIEGNNNFENAVSGGSVSGTEGQNKKITKLSISTLEKSGISFRAYINGAWTEWKNGGSTIDGNGKDIEALQIKLSGELANTCDVYYRTHNRYYGWLGWTSNGTTAGSRNTGSAIEGYQIQLVEKGTTVEGITNSTTEASKEKCKVVFKDYDGTILKEQNVEYGANATAPSNPTRVGYAFKGWSGSYTNVKSDVEVTAQYGDCILYSSVVAGSSSFQTYVTEGKVSGTEGQSKKITKLCIKTVSANGISFRAYINGAWTDWKTSGSTIAGNGQNIQALQIKLTGELANKYNVYYRTHNSYYGWLGWTSNGATAGTRNMGQGIEGYEIRLVEKGKTVDGITNDTKEASKEKYKVVFKDGNTVLKEELVEYGGSATAPKNTAKTGYTFTGWSGSYTNVKDDVEITANYDRDIKITSVDINGGADVIAGKKAYIKINTNCTDNLVYSVDIHSIAGNMQLANKVSSNVIEWTPTENYAGTYCTIEIAVRDSSLVGASAIYTAGCSVKQKTENITTIYYKGYENPNIHYQIGNGDWTKVPGVKMEANSEVEGYNYAVTINLGDADSLTACFNDGNNNWDSKGGENYTFGAGYYTYSNQKITKISKPKKELEITNLTASPENSIVEGQQVIFKTETKDAQGTLKYKYTATSANGTTQVLRDYSTYNDLSWLPGAVGKYKITVYVTDGVTTQEKSINYEVTEFKNVSVSKLESSLGTEFVLGKTTTISLSAKDGYSSSYSYSVKVNGTEILPNASTTSVKWTPSQTGSYTVAATVTDARGVKSQKSMTINVVEGNTTTIYYKGYTNPNIHYQIGNGSWTKAPGVKLEANSEVDGYNYAITIDLGDATSLTACFNDGNNNWDSNDSKNYSFGTGYYTYSNKQATKIAKPEKGLKITNLTASPEGSIVEGQQVIFKTVTENAQGTLKYKYTATSSNGTTQVLRDYSTYNDLAWLPGSTGKYKITVYVTDGVSTKEKSIDYEVTEFKNVNVSKLESSLGTEFVVGNTTNISVAAKDGHSSAYYYSIKVNGTEILPNTSSTTASWT